MLISMFCATYTVCAALFCHAGIDYTLYADNRPSGLSARAQFSTETSVISGMRTLTVGGVNDCDTLLLYVTVSVHQHASASNKY